MSVALPDKYASLLQEARPVKVNDLQPYYMNAKEHDIPTIKESLGHLGQFAPLVVNVGSKTGRENEILAGNGTWEAAVDLGWPLVDCHFVDVDDDTARRINLVANAAQQRAGYNKDLLIESLGLLAEDDLVATGYTEADVAKMLTPFDPTADLDADAQMGDLEFRVIVDCSSEDDQRRLIEKLESEGRTVRALIA